MKSKIFVGIKSLLTAYALTATFHVPFFVSQFESLLDYVIASVYELLGDYQLEFVLIWVMSVLFYGFIDKKTGEKGIGKLYYLIKANNTI